MPALAAITVKKFDGTTDITYSPYRPASGDGSWALLRQDIGNSNPYAARPTFAVRTLESKSGIRRVEVLFVYPYFWTDSTTAQIVISPLNVSNRNGAWVVPQGIPPSFIQEATAQYAGLMNSTLIKQCLIDQSALT